MNAYTEDKGRPRKRLSFSKRVGWWISAKALEGFSFFVGKVPRHFLSKLASVLGILAFYMVPRLQRIGVENLSKVFGSRIPKPNTLIKANLENIIYNVLEIAQCYFSRESQRYLEKTIAIQGQEHLENALKKGKGVLTVSAHLGNFPLIGARMATLGYSFWIIYKEPENIYLKALFSEWMHYLGMGIIPYKPRRVCVSESIKVLRNNGIIFLQIDQNPRKGHGVDIDFLGCQVPTYRGPAVMATRTGAAIVPMFIHRNANDTETIDILPELTPIRSKETNQDIIDNLRVINSVCEEWIRRYPEQWWWIHRRFRQARQLTHPQAQGQQTMLLKEEFKRSGTWLFRWRSLLPLLIITLFLGAFINFHYPSASHNLDQLWEIMCLALSFMGLGVRAFTLGSVPKGTSGRNTRRIKGDSLNTTGMYSVVRHPLYLGNFIIGLGVSLFFRLWWFTLIYVLIFWLYYERIIFAEEEFLLKKFGQPYLKWAEKTPTFIPKSKNWKPSAFPFSFRTALKREYQTLMAITASFAFLEILGDFFVKGRIVFDPVWMIIFSLGALIWTTLRLIHKKAKILNVERR